MTKLYPHVEISHVNPELKVRGTKDTEPRIGNGYFPFNRPNTDARYKAFTIEQIHITHKIRMEAAKDKDESGMPRLLPPLPCPYKICAHCEPLRAFWVKALADYQPHTLSLL